MIGDTHSATGRTGTGTFLPTRSSLLERLKAWDNEAGWKEFFDTYQRSILGLAMKCGLSRSEAEEVVQDTMVAVARKMPDFEYDRSLGSFKGWLFTITRRAVGKQLSKRQTGCLGPLTHSVEAGGGEGEGTAVELPDPAPGFEERWEEDWRHNLLDMAIDRVRRRTKPKQFQMFDLYVTQQLPMDQVTRILNVNAAQVYMAKLRISSAVRHELAQLQKKLI
jgi:RNA polymerase sigma-70 factor (ECF subfamily)